MQQNKCLQSVSKFVIVLMRFSQGAGSCVTDFHCNAKGGVHMEYVFSFLLAIAKVIVKEIVAAFAKYFISRIKGKIAPQHRDDSDLK